MRLLNMNWDNRGICFRIIVRLRLRLRLRQESASHLDIRSSR